jgi:NTE family protein
MATRTKAITLALQGGGAHGAFTWGVLDRLLEEEALVIEGISGTSAGAMNAAVLADGLECGGRGGAREALGTFWRAISERGAWSPLRSSWLTPWGLDFSPMAHWFDLVTQVASPYQFNPLNINPLADVLERSIDFQRLRQCRQVKLFISATNVLTNRLRIFTSEQISREVLLASTCLPHLHQAVEIDGEHYWDGGFLGNPVLEPLVSECSARDLVVVQVNPTHRERVPIAAHDILDRVNEITFNATLMREIRSIAAMTHLLEAGEVHDPRLQSTYFHMIAGEQVMQGLGLRTKYDTNWRFLSDLRERGRAQAEAWLAANFDALGRRSTLNFREWAPSYGRHAAPEDAPPPTAKEARG